jgi:hypothetical protein
MDQAKDLRTGRIVWATDASVYADFACPVCGAAVFLRRGYVRAAHFAHKSGLASPECELYFFSEDIRNPWPSSPLPPVGDSRGGEQIAPLALSIAIEPEQQTRPRHLRRWELCVTIPKSNDSRGQISFDCGAGVHRNVYLSRSRTHKGDSLGGRDVIQAPQRSDHDPTPIRADGF